MAASLGMNSSSLNAAFIHLQYIYIYIYIYVCIYNRLGWASESQHKLLFIRIEL